MIRKLAVHRCHPCRMARVGVGARGGPQGEPRLAQDPPGEARASCPTRLRSCSDMAFDTSFLSIRGPIRLEKHIGLSPPHRLFPDHRLFRPPAVRGKYEARTGPVCSRRSVPSAAIMGLKVLYQIQLENQALEKQRPGPPAGWPAAPGGVTAWRKAHVGSRRGGVEKARPAPAPAGTTLCRGNPAWLTEGRYRTRGPTLDSGFRQTNGFATPRLGKGHRVARTTTGPPNPQEERAGKHEDLC